MAFWSTCGRTPCLRRTPYGPPLTASSCRGSKASASNAEGDGTGWSVGAAAVVGEEPRARRDMVEVGGEEEVVFRELEDDAAALVKGVLDGVDMVGPRYVGCA